MCCLIGYVLFLLDLSYLIYAQILYIELIFMYFNWVQYWLMCRCSSTWNDKASALLHCDELLLGVSNWEAYGKWYCCWLLFIVYSLVFVICIGPTNYFATVTYCVSAHSMHTQQKAW